MIETLQDAADYLDGLKTRECGLAHERLVQGHRGEMVLANLCPEQRRIDLVSCAHCHYDHESLEGNEMPAESPIRDMLKVINFLVQEGILYPHENFFDRTKAEHKRIVAADEEKSKLVQDETTDPHALAIMRAEIDGYSEQQKKRARNLEQILRELRARTSVALRRTPLEMTA